MTHSDEYWRGYGAGGVDESIRAGEIHARVHEIAVLGAKAIVEAQAANPGCDIAAYFQPATETTFGRILAGVASDPELAGSVIGTEPVPRVPEAYIAAWLYMRLQMLPCLPHAPASRKLAGTTTSTRSVQ